MMINQLNPSRIMHSINHTLDLLINQSIDISTLNIPVSTLINLPTTRQLWHYPTAVNQLPFNISNNCSVKPCNQPTNQQRYLLSGSCGNRKSSWTWPWRVRDSRCRPTRSSSPPAAPTSDPCWRLVTDTPTSISAESWLLLTYYYLL